MTQLKISRTRHILAIWNCITSPITPREEKTWRGISKHFVTSVTIKSIVNTDLLVCSKKTAWALSLSILLQE